MKVTDLVEGEIYYVNWSTGSSYLFEYNKNERNHNINIETNEFNFKSGDFTTFKCWSNIEVASYKYKLWLSKCIELNKFIPFSKIKEMKQDYKYLIKILKRYNIK